MASSITLWYVNDFENIWLDKYERSTILSLDYETLSNILSSGNLNVKSEYIVWKVIHDWVNADKDNRLEHFPDLIFKCLRFGRLDKNFINIYIFECDLFMSLTDVVQKQVKDLITETFQISKQTTTYNFNLSSLNNVIYFWQRKILLACINIYDGSSQFYNHQLHSWHSSPVSLQLPNEQYEYELALLGNVLYVFGGKDYRNFPTFSMWSRNLSNPTTSSQWTARADMNQRREWFSSVVLNQDTIYALGGKDKHDSPCPYLRSCERYSSELNQWSMVAELNRERYGASAAVLDGCIYIGGGWDGKKDTLRSVEKYDPVTNVWVEVAPMSTARSNFTLTFFADRLWAAGGWDGDHQPLASVESYDPVTDSWREETPLKKERVLHTAVEFNGELYVVGGKTKNDLVLEPTNVVEKYVPTVGWVKDSELLKGRGDFQLLIIPLAYSSFFLTDSK